MEYTVHILKQTDKVSMIILEKKNNNNNKGIKEKPK